MISKITLRIFEWLTRPFASHRMKQRDSTKAMARASASLIYRFAFIVSLFAIVGV